MGNFRCILYVLNNTNRNFVGNRFTKIIIALLINLLIKILLFGGTRFDQHQNYEYEYDSSVKKTNEDKKDDNTAAFSYAASLLSVQKEYEEDEPSSGGGDVILVRAERALFSRGRKTSYGRLVVRRIRAGKFPRLDHHSVSISKRLQPRKQYFGHS